MARPRFKPGDLVRLHTPGHAHPGFTPTGIITATEVIDRVTHYTVRWELTRSMERLIETSYWVGRAWTNLQKPLPGRWLTPPLLIALRTPDIMACYQETKLPPLPAQKLSFGHSEPSAEG